VLASPSQMASVPVMVDPISPHLLEMIVCPRDKKELRLQGGRLTCAAGHSYGILEGTPILLVDDAEQTHIEGDRSLLVGQTGDASQVPRFEIGPGEIDPFVQQSIAATNGNLYQSLIGNLTDYPIPQLRMPTSNGAAFLEIGCSWGRWSIAAARAGFRAVGIDPSLKGVRAAQRVARQLGIEATYLVADGRFLPFREASFVRVFSYSVLQHLSRQDVMSTLAEVSRVLLPDGTCTVQMANTFGLRSLQHQAARGFREATDFEVRYWTPRQLRTTFSKKIGPSTLSVDGFFSLNAQMSDARLLPLRHRAVVYASEIFRRLSGIIPLLKYFADSLYVEAQKPA
jgi:2-polyprenyl-3-methyl-5-hydroxy-6-metoxy-1,4-benzoquinol methylase/uncharacterized protein YbaR (Trm112 family)